MNKYCQIESEGGNPCKNQCKECEEYFNLVEDDEETDDEVWKDIMNIIERGQFISSKYREVVEELKSNFKTPQRV